MAGALSKGASSAEDILAMLEEMKTRNVPTYGPRMFRPSYYAGEDVVAVAERAFALFIKENWLYGRTSYPAVGTFEDEVLASVLDLFHAPQGAGGTLTSGGTESLILAVKLARDHARATGRGGEPFNAVLPHTAHPAFDKGGDLLGVEIRRAPQSVGYGADLDWMRDACDERTVMVVGSAPPYPFGEVDPIRELSAIAREREAWFHVDACLGGMVLPFVEAAGKTMPEFDFRIPGVDSISVDLHKFGYAMKGISALATREKRSARYAQTVFKDWPAGLYATPGVAGTRSAGSLASAWAVMRYLGAEGYRQRTAEILGYRDEFIDHLSAVGGRVLGRPDCFHFNFTVDGVPAITLAEELTRENWIISATENPDSVQLMITAAHRGMAAPFSQDVERISRDIKSGTRKGTGAGAIYSKIDLDDQLAKVRAEG